MNCCVQEQKRKDQKLSYDGDFPEAEVKVEPSLPTTPLAPGGLSKAEARRKIKSQEKRDQMEKIRRRSIEKLVSGGATPPPWKAGAKAVAERKPPDIAARGVVVVQPSCPPPPRLPALPTTPIPVSELPPAAVRSPPAKVIRCSKVRLGCGSRCRRLVPCCQCRPWTRGLSHLRTIHCGRCAGGERTH